MVLRYRLFVIAAGNSGMRRQPPLTASTAGLVVVHGRGADEGHMKDTADDRKVGKTYNFSLNC